MWEQPPRLSVERSSTSLPLRKYTTQLLRRVHLNIRGLDFQRVGRKSIRHSHSPESRVAPRPDIDMRIAHDRCLLGPYAGLNDQFQSPFRIRLLGGEAVAAV